MAEKIDVKLIGEDGNIFFIMGKVSKELRMNNQDEDARIMCQRIMSSKSYHEALAIVQEYVNII